MLAVPLPAPAAPPPAAPDAPPNRAELVALHARLRATLLNCYAHARAPWEHFSGIGCTELAALNADFELLRRVNDALAPRRRSPRLAGWPVPVFPTRALIAARDLVPALEIATHLACTALYAPEFADA